jgi:hypothetical protein
MNSGRPAYGVGDLIVEHGGGIAPPSVGCGESGSRHADGIRGKRRRLRPPFQRCDQLRQQPRLGSVRSSLDDRSGDVRDLEADHEIGDLELLVAQGARAVFAEVVTEHGDRSEGLLR